MLDPGSVPADDRGLAYGDGLFETLRITDNGHAPLAEAHARRMAAGARRLGIPLEEDAWWRALNELCLQGPGVGKLLLTRGSGGRGYAPPDRPKSRLLQRHQPLPARPARHSDTGLITGLAPTRLGDQPELAGLKHANRLEQVLARREADRQGWDEALMLDAAGRSQCLASMNLFAVSEGVMLTPPVDRSGVAGVMREWILQEGARKAGVPARVQRLGLERLRTADEVFASNAVAGVLPIATLGVWRWPRGPVTRVLMDQTRELLS